ncbi:MAG: type II secretion system protein [Burkholderiaceae bacterium]|nr:type II secretion system protein [Burkholderiaceae bacterium]
MQDQRGFVLLELVVGALIVTLLAVWGANTLARRMDEASAQAAAVWMLSVRGAAQAYVGHYAATLSQADPSVLMKDQGYADWAAPTLDELKANGLLATGFPDHVQLAGSADIRVMREGDCPGSLCRVTAFVTSSRPLLRLNTDQVDEHMVALWLMAVQGLGGKVSDAQPQWLSGASFKYANPPVAGMVVLPPGTVVLVVTPEQSGSSDFLRVGDSRDPDFQGELTVQGDVVAAADFRVGRNLILDSEASWMMGCDDEGAITKDDNGGLLMCRSGLWQSTGRGGGGYSLEATTGCTGAGINPLTNNCSCPPHHSRVLISDSGPGAPGGYRLLGYVCVSR